MTSTDYKLAEALVARLAALLPTRTVELVGDPRADRKSMTALKVFVRPAAWAQNEDTRAAELDTRDLHVAIVGPCHGADVEALDAYLAACDQVRALWGEDGPLRDAVIADHEPVGVLRQSPLWDDELLLSTNLFVGVITVQYQTFS